MGDQAFRFVDLVREDLIIPGLSAGSREEVLTVMANRLVAEGYCKDTFPAAILERERNHPSGLPMAGHKIAIPHVDAEHVLRSAILFARLTEPVEWRSMGNPDETLPVQMVSMFALREKTRIGDLLETLITVYQNNDVLDSLLHAADASGMFAVLRYAVSNQAG